MINENQENQDRMISSITESVLEAMKPMLAETCEITKGLQCEVLALKTQVAELQAKLSQKTQTPSPVIENSLDFSDVLKETMKSTMDEEKLKRELVLSKVEEGNDQQFLADLRSKIGISTQVQNAERIGKKDDERKRLLKVTFHSQFDARCFKTRFEEREKDDPEIPKIKVRFSKTKEQRETFAKNSKIAFKLNQEAKNTGAEYSFSLRENGDLWKYQKQGDGKWRRVKDWEMSTENSGNE